MPKEKIKSQVIDFTEAAARFIKRMAEDAGKEPILHLKVLPGGCSGMKYAMEFILESDIRSTDEIVKAYDVTVCVDSASVPFLEGAKIETDDDLLAPGLKIDNPQASASCGCGKSFN